MTTINDIHGWPIKPFAENNSTQYCLPEDISILIHDDEHVDLNLISLREYNILIMRSEGFSLRYIGAYNKISSVRAGQLVLRAISKLLKMGDRYSTSTIDAHLQAFVRDHEKPDYKL